MRKKKSKKTAVKSKRKPASLPRKEIQAETEISPTGLATQLEIPQMLTSQIPLEPASDDVLQHAIEKVEQEIEKVCDSDYYSFDFSVHKESLDAQIREVREHLKKLMAMKHEMYPGFLRRVFRHICRR